MSRGPATFRQQDVTRALKAVATAGIKVQRVEIDKTGKIVVIAANDAAPDDDNELAEFRRAHGYR